MIGISLKVKSNFSSAAIAKQIGYGTMRGVNLTLEESQVAVQKALLGFTLRNNKWWAASSRLGIRIRKAKLQDNPIAGRIYSEAGWLIKQKIGGHIPAGTKHRRIFPYRYAGEEYIARPANTLRAPGSTKVLEKKLWPQNLKRAFVIRNEHDTLILMVRFAPGPKGIIPMYILDKDIAIKPKDTFYDPVSKVVERRLAANIGTEVQNALDKIREIK